MDVRSAIIQRVSDRFMRFRAAFEQFDGTSAEREKVGPNWNVRDLVGHMAHWTNEAAARMTDFAAGKPSPEYDLRRINDDVYRKNRRMSYVMLLPQLRAAEEKALAALSRAPSDQMIGDTPLRTWIDETLIDHYDHHWPGLEAALARTGSASLE